MMKNKISKNLYKFAFDYIKKYPLALFASVFVHPIIQITEQLIPWIISRVVDMVNLDSSPQNVWEYVISNVWIVVLLLVLGTSLNMIVETYNNYKLAIENGVIVRKDLFKIVIEKSFRFWNKNPSGTVYNKLNILMRSVLIDSGLLGGWVSLYHRFIEVAIILFFVAKIHLPLAIIFFVCALLLAVVLASFSDKVEDASKEMSIQKTKAFSKVVDITLNFFLIKTFGSKHREAKYLQTDLNNLKVASQNYRSKFLHHTTAQQCLILFIQIGLILYSVSLWARQVISVGDVIYIITTLANLMLSFRIMGYIILGVKEVKGSINSAVSTFNEEVEIKNGTKNLKVKNGAIEFKNVCFSYDGKQEVLHNINLKISPQEKIGIVGLSGCGKTTLAHLLLRMYDTTSGQILIDGQDIKEQNLNSLYKNIAFIPQDTSLFHRSIKENILYGTFVASKEQVTEVARQSYVDEFIKKLPQGYDTLVGDKGVKLSGGQRQRVGIARAIFKNSPILVLDEATSALDSLSEKYIQKSIATIIKDKTVIAIAHRLSTLKEMDRIIVIDNGKIIEEGSPKKLLSKKGRFAKLWKIQMEL